MQPKKGNLDYMTDPNLGILIGFLYNHSKLVKMILQ